MDQLDEDSRSLLNLPWELREQILSYIVQLGHIISYDCPLGHHYFHYSGQYSRWQCGQRSQPNISFLRNRREKYLSIMRVNRQLCYETLTILYNRKFQLDIGDDAFYFVNLSSVDSNTLRQFKFSLMRSLVINIEAKEEATALTIASTIERLTRICAVLAKATVIKHIQVQMWFSIGSEATPITIEGLFYPFTVLQNTTNVDLVIRKSLYGLACECDDQEPLAMVSFPKPRLQATYIRVAAELLSSRARKSLQSQTKSPIMDQIMDGTVVLP